MITCPRCGYQAPDGTPYCPHCGYGKPVQAQPVPADPPKQEPKPAADPEQPKQKKSSNTELIALALIMLIAAVAFAVANVISAGQLRNMQHTATAMAGDLTALQQTVTAYAALPTAEPTITPTPKAEVPSLCMDEQASLIRLADVLDADGHPYPGDFDRDMNACIYRISDNDSFLNMGTFGHMVISHDPADHPYSALIEISYKDNDQIRELIKDWGAAAASYLAPDLDPISATTLIKAVQAAGLTSIGNYTLSAKLDTDTMNYQIFIVNMLAVSEE